MEERRSTKYECPKCSNRSFDMDEIRAVGGFWSKIFDLQNKRFTTITCTKCSFTEFYKKKASSTGENIFDVFTT